MECLDVRFTFGKITNAFWTHVRFETNKTFRTFARTMVGTEWNRNRIDTSFHLPTVRKRHTVTVTDKQSWVTGHGSIDWWVTWVMGHKIWPIVSSGCVWVKGTSVITEIRRKKLGPLPPPFRVTRGHWNWHGLISFLWNFLFNDPHGPILCHFGDKRRFRSKVANFSHRQFLYPCLRGSTWNFVTALVLKQTKGCLTRWFK